MRSCASAMVFIAASRPSVGGGRYQLCDGVWWSSPGACRRIAENGNLGLQAVLYTAQG